MIEYIFFDTTLQHKFVVLAQNLGVPCELEDDFLGFVVAVPEALSDEIDDALERCYDELQQEQAALLKQTDGGYQQIAGVRYTLPDGQVRMTALSTDIANRLLSVFSIEEVQSLFENVAKSALSEVDKPLCHML